MLKILVAEDEKLIRKGIIGLIDWNQYDSKIIGEVGTSKAVLEFLMCHEVDIHDYLSLIKYVTSYGAAVVVWQRYLQYTSQ